MKLRRNNNKTALVTSHSFMVSIKNYSCTLLAIATCIFFVPASYAKERALEFPFLAEVLSDNVNVRAGQSSNFEKMLQLKKGEDVVIEGAAYSWYKIRLPKKAKVYISSKYIQHLVDNKAIVLADKVNVRAGPDIKFSIIGQLNRGDEVEIVESKPEWVQIVPWAKSYGWISQEFTRFKSKDVSSWEAGLVQENSPGSLGQQPVPAAPALLGDNNTLMRLRGKVIKVSFPSDVPKEVQYQLNTQEGSFYLLSVDNILGRFKNKQVKIEGKIAGPNDPAAKIPLIKVSKIELIL